MITDLNRETFNNLIDFYFQIAESAGLECGQHMQVPYVMNHDGSWPNYILGGNISNGEQLDAFTKDISIGKLPPFWIRTDESDEFEELAWERGIRQINYWSGMYLIRKTALKNPVNDKMIRIESLSSVSDLRLWLKIVNSEVLTGKSVDFKLFRELIFSKEFNFFSLWYGKKMISTALIFLKDGVAGIYFVSTLRVYRGNGYGTLITSSIIDHYISKGIDKFVLHSTPLGFPVYKKLGFTENMKFGIYWMVGKK